MRGVAWLVLAVSAACVESFDLGTVRLNHQPVASGAVWAASSSSFADAIRDPSVVVLAGRTLTIGPDACAGCQFDRATLAFALAAELVVEIR